MMFTQIEEIKLISTILGILIKEILPTTMQPLSSELLQDHLLKPQSNN